MLKRAGKKVKAAWKAKGFLDLVGYGDPNLVQTELESGIDLDQIYFEHSLGERALVIAVDRGHANIVKLLLNCDPEAARKYGKNALLCAITKNERIRNRRLSREIIALLLQFQVEKDAQSKTHYYTPLHYLSSHDDYKDLVRKLLNAGANPALRDYEKKTPLIRATCKGCSENVKELLKPKFIGQVQIDAVDKFGNSALHYAAKNGYYSIVKSLLKAHANPNIANFNGNTPLHLAVMFGHHKIASLLASNGADDTIVNNNGLTADQIGLEKDGLDRNDYLVSSNRSSSTSSIMSDISEEIDEKVDLVRTTIAGVEVWTNPHQLPLLEVVSLVPERNLKGTSKQEKTQTHSPGLFAPVQKTHQQLTQQQPNVLDDLHQAVVKWGDSGLSQEEPTEPVVDDLIDFSDPVEKIELQQVSQNTVAKVDEPPTTEELIQKLKRLSVLSTQPESARHRHRESEAVCSDGAVVRINASYQ